MSDSRLYNPSAFRSDDDNLLAQVIDGTVFGSLISNGADGPRASHLPFLLRDSASGGRLLRAHLARANDHWKLLHDAPVLAIFHGPAHYVSPGWYASKTDTGKVVPTWNYMVVHARGRARVWHDAQRLRALVEDLTDHMERNRAAPWAVDDAPADYLARMTAQIVGVDIELEQLEGKFKLGQNRSAEDRASLAMGLAAERLDVAAALAELLPDWQGASQQ
ncbi:MAG: FMN-binding negative transcriptional regulator [Pseudomonadales bacterium]